MSRSEGEDGVGESDFGAESGDKKDAFLYLARRRGLQAQSALLGPCFGVLWWMGWAVSVAHESRRWTMAGFFFAVQSALSTRPSKPSTKPRACPLPDQPGVLRLPIRAS